MKIYNIKILMLCFIVIFGFVNCSKNKKISENYLLNITNPNYSGLIVIQPQKKVFGSLNNKKLYSLYNGYFKIRYSYKEFILKLISGELPEINNYVEADKSFQENEEIILNELKKNGLSFIIKKYIDADGNSESLILNSSIEFFIVIKIMFDNNYYIYFNEYRGDYTFRKTPDREVIMLDVSD